MLDRDGLPDVHGGDAVRHLVTTIEDHRVAIRAPQIEIWHRDSHRLVVKAGADQHQITGVGAPAALCLSSGGHPYLYSSNSNPDNNNSIQAAVTGEVYKMELDGTVLGKFGKAGKQLKEFGTIHSMDCKVPNDLVVGEITSWRVQKLTLRPPATQSSLR